MNHASPIRAILGCLFVAESFLCGICGAQDVDRSGPARQEDPGVRKAADALALQLGAPSNEVRQNAATALEAMGFGAGKALASYIFAELNDETQRENAVARMQGITKAATILGKIGRELPRTRR